MSGIKRKLEGSDPDYEDISMVQDCKRNKVAEDNAREETVQKIEAIIREQFSLEMKNKEHEIDVISQRLNEARRMMDKLRACIVANYYASAGMTKVPGASKSDAAGLNHPAIKRFLESPSRSSSPLNQGSETPSLVHSESESISQQGEGAERDGDVVWGEENGRKEHRPGRNTGKDTFGVQSSVTAEQRVTYHTTGDEASRLYAKKTIVVGNVSKYIPPDKREDNDQSTHKWMVYVRGSRREPSINHFVKKVWFFLHPSYKPNDLVEVSEPPFHLTRRGWGEFPVRIQIHFKDPRNKRIDIIHQLKLDRTYTGLQTLGAETVVDVELHRNSLGEDYIPQPSSSKGSQRASSPMSVTSMTHSYGRPMSPMSHYSIIEKAEAGRSAASHSISLSCGERTPTRPKASDRITLGSHGNSAFQPITASCKIAPQSQASSPVESPGKSFQPITMSCKIVSGSPLSTPSHSPLPHTSTPSTPVHAKQTSSSVLSNPYVIVDKPGQVTGMASSGSPSAKQSAAQGTRSPAPKVHTGTFLSSGVKVIIKQEPGEVSTQQQQMVSTVTNQQQPAASAAHQFVTVKGGHVISMSGQKQSGGATTSKMFGIPVSSTLQSAVRQVAIGSGQILVAKGSSSASKVIGGKQVLAQGVAKAIVTGPSGFSGQQTASKGGGSGGSKSGVMATLQLPANNLANLASLPPGTKLYLTTNSKSPSGKGKLLLIPQGAILRASSAGQHSQSSSSAGTGGSQTTSSSSSSSSQPSNLSYTSYILKQTPQVTQNAYIMSYKHYRCAFFLNVFFLPHFVDPAGTFLVASQDRGSGKQGGSSSTGHTSSSASVTQQAIRVTPGQKAAILAQVADGGKSASQHPSLLVAANQAAVINAAKSASAAAGSNLSKGVMATLIKSAGSSATLTKGAAGSTGSIVTVAKGVTSMPGISMSKGGGTGNVGGVPKSANTSLVTAASLVSGMAAGGGKTAATLSGMLKIHSGGSSSQQTVLTIPANQLKQLGCQCWVRRAADHSHACWKRPSLQYSFICQHTPGAGGAGASPGPGGQAATSLAVSLAQVKMEPGAGTAGLVPPVTASALSIVHGASTMTAVKQEQGLDNSTHDLINTEHIETMMQLLTAVVKKFPLIVPNKIPIFLTAEAGRSAASHSISLSCGERTPTRPKASDRITLGSHGNSAFQPITASCKIAPQSQASSPVESPGKSFQPITMSCKIVSGSPLSTPSHSPLPHTFTPSTPVHAKQTSSSVLSNPYVIVDKPGQVTGMASSGSPSAKQSAAQGTRSPAPKVHTGTFLSSGVKVIIKQEPGEVSTQQQQMVSTVTNQQQPAASAAHQFVTVKGGHVISMSGQKQSGGATTSKMFGIPVSSTLQSAVRQVAIGSGQILVAKGSSSASKVIGGKQVLAQGVAKAIVTGPSGFSGQQTASKGGGSGGSKSGVMATLQLPANNLANLASLPPGTKLYLTTNSKSPSGKGKLLLIPQGAILRASSAGQHSQSSSSAGTGGSQTTSSSSSSSSQPSNLSYTSYILKQTPQGTFLVGQPGQSSGKQGGSSSTGHTSSSASVTQQAIRVTPGQKAAILAQMAGNSSAQVKLSDGSVKAVTAATAGHLSKSGATTLRMASGLVTGANSTASSVSAATAGSQQQVADGGKSASQHPSLLVAANQAAVINAAKSASAAAGSNLSKGVMATLIKSAGSSATLTKGAAGSTGSIVTVAKGVTSMPGISMSKGGGTGNVGGVPKSANTSLVTAASLVSGMAAGGGKTAATLSGMLKIHSGGSSSQQTVLTIPANQLKQLGVSAGSGGLQTILMPVGKVVSKGPVSSTPSSVSTTPGAGGAGASPGPGGQAATSLAVSLAQVKMEPGAGTAGLVPPVTASALSIVHGASTMTAVKQEQGLDNSTHDLINTEHIETMMQLLTAVVKKFPLIVPNKTEDSHPFCASSTEQYYSWNIGKRRASELQRAVAVKRVIQDVLDRSPRLQALSPPKTREVVQWCRQRGYTPPDPEPQRKNDDESIEDILTQIDNEPECPSTLSGCEELVLRLEQVQTLLKTEPEDTDNEIVDITTVTPACQKLKLKEEEQDSDSEPKFFLCPCLSAQFVSETAQQIGVTFQPVEVEKNVFSSVVEAMILKATEQLASDILREALAGAYTKSSQNRAPREITAMNIHQAVSSIPTCDFFTNAHMGYMAKGN
ncbi:LOW QUALITY PROTEIN: YEATS domain-containing protein 2 [Thalassophryne amazonica]|uniref:LOW QUALITY PROTEIN: YEATS domain-containing protein 2 n=1 Tax=Thalassophryne amazonica TaxID=390379 RepID=UPI001470D035|nr:LOW QUALITY PROTEIN: YEATS domain-containing protein 2 [Thalassophryne amazonica]